jgi:succinoglycan biosynthesis protein ExoM
MAENKHISVCICTFKRQLLLKRLLDELDHQITEGLFTYSAVIVDNDYAQSAKHVVLEFSPRSSMFVNYCVEPQQNIALARNKALENAHGDYIAFIDDDEYPTPNWLCTLFKNCNAIDANFVFGPVQPSFEKKPPNWAIKGSFFERPRHKTGHIIGLSEARTGNVMFRREILDWAKRPFRAEFGTGGEDIDFFRRYLDKGCTFVWCDEAVVYEVVSPTRCTRSYLLRRALFRGRNFYKQKGGLVRNLIKSFVAVPAYGLALPFLFIAGEHHFMKYMIKFCDHAGRLLALLRLNPIRERDP